MALPVTPRIVASTGGGLGSAGMICTEVHHFHVLYVVDP
jgi:hypothetical protein